MDPRPDPDCRRKALDLLARRSHFRRQLEEKLLARSFEMDDVGNCLDRLEAEGLVDDLRTARELVASRLRRGPEGRRRLLYELRKRGASESVAEAALDDLPESDLEAARRAAAAWARRGGTDATALARHLDRKGFAAGSVLEVVRESTAGRDDLPAD